VTAPTASRFVHEAFLHRGDEEFLTGVLPHVREGLENDEAVLVVEPRPRLHLLREALGDDAAAVDLVDMERIGANPARIIPFWAAAVAEHAASGRGLRGVDEPAHGARRPAELLECEVHEALLNHAFDPGPAWHLLCPYDVTALPAAMREAALRTHPAWWGPGAGGPSPTFVPTGDGLDLAALPRAGALPPPTDVVLRGEFGRADLPAVRRTVRQYARSCGLDDEQVESLELAASELASNCVRHGGGGGSLAMWQEPDAAVVEFTDTGRITDPLLGRRRPHPDQEGGMGLYLVHQLCDLVQVRTGPAGTTVRVTTWV
jgi:anti-sigma regulatory factor (Ser/Thr protein kinase)